MSLTNLCAPETFVSLSLFGAEVLSVETTLVTNYTASAPSVYRYTQQSTEALGIDFCNVTVSYTHPGQGDNIIVEAWLPSPEDWNERLQAVGGGGWAAGRFFLSYGAMNGAIADGYVTITTDAGLGAAVEATPWAQVSEGNVNLYNLQNLASVSLNDEAIIGKSLIKSLYGQEPKYSYWSGCSQGGRQGLMLAQRYPDAYDGIAAGAPAIYWTEFFPGIQWAQQVMSMLGKAPHECEIDALVAAAVSECDGLDGVVDGIIGEIEACLDHFDLFKLVGSSIECSDAGNTSVSDTAATVVNFTWHGMQTEDGKRTWYGIPPGADLTGNSPASYGQPGVAETDCTSGTCVGVANVLGLQWLQLFVAKDPSNDLSNLTHAEFDTLVDVSGQIYRSMINTDDPDLSRFRAAGGKLVTFHGLADNVIPPQGTEQYYREVSSLLPDVQDFYRHFEAPGLGHCFGGKSGQPEALFEQLRAWVENGTAPEKTPVKITDTEGKEQDRVLCPYPQKAEFDTGCGESGDSECWACVDAGASKCLRK